MVGEKTEVCDLSCIVELSVEFPFTTGTYEKFRYAQDEIIENFLCRTRVASGYGNIIVDLCNLGCNYHSLSASFSRRKATLKEITKRFEDGN